MNSASILHQVGIDTTPAKVFNAIASLDGISHWWTSATGCCGLNKTLSLHFGEHLMKMQITELQTNQLLKWRCTSGNEQWVNTEISFELEATDNQVLLDFSHTGWQEQTPLFRHCNTKWAVFMVSLKKYLEDGKGLPYPYDIQINHS